MNKVNQFGIQSTKFILNRNFHYTKTTTTSLLSSSTTSTKTFNNTNDEDKHGLIQQYHKKYKIKGNGTNTKVEMITNTNHIIQTDIPTQMGGTNEAPQPVELLLASWIGCTQATAIFVSRNMNVGSRNDVVGQTKKAHEALRIVIDKMEFDIEAFRDERGALGGELPIKLGSELPEYPARLEKIEGMIKVYAKERKGGDVYVLTDDELNVLAHQTERRCPVGKK